MWGGVDLDKNLLLILYNNCRRLSPLFVSPFFGYHL